MVNELVKKEQQEMTRGGAEQLIDEGNAYSPNVDLYISEDDAVFIFDLPGVKKGDVKIEIEEDNTLVVRAQNSHEAPNDAVLKEYKTGNYFRSFKLSNDYDKNSVKALLENGVLTVTVPKKEDAKPHKIEINA